MKNSKLALKGILAATVVGMMIASSGLFGVKAKKVTTRFKAPATTEREYETALRKYPHNKTEFELVVDRLNFIAYDKKASSGVETFFVDNGSEKDLSSIELEITYYASTGIQIHKRTVSLNHLFPAKESRKVDIKSWDKQHGFHYINSVPSIKGSTPYTVSFKVLSFKLT